MLTQGDALLKATAKAAFWQSYEAYPSIMGGMVAPVTSDSTSEDYPWLAYAPAVREMIGSRVKRNVPELKWTIANKKWENTVAIAWETRKFAKLNQVQALLGNLGAKARAYPDKLVSGLIANGNTAGNTCYDTRKFYDTGHFDAGAAYTATQTNYFTTEVPAAATTLWTDLEIAYAINFGRGKLMSYKDGDGDPVWMDPNAPIVVQCSVDMYPRVAVLQTAAQLTGGASNPVLGAFKVIANPWLPDSGGVDQLWCFNVSGAHKPFILQTAEPVTLEDDMGGDNDFNTKDVNFGSFGYYNGSYGDWRYSVYLKAS